MWFKELERSESPPPTPPQEFTKGAPGAQGDCPKRPELSLSPHQHLPFPILSSCLCSFPSLLPLPTSPSLFLSTPWPTLTLRCRILLGSRSQSWGPRHRDQGAGPDTWRPHQEGGVSGNSGQTPASDPRPGPAHATPLSLPATFPCFLSGKAISAHACLLLPREPQQDRSYQGPRRLSPSHLGHAGRPRPSSSKPRLPHCQSLPILRPHPSQSEASPLTHSSTPHLLPKGGFSLATSPTHLLLACFGRSCPSQVAHYLKP